MKTILNIRVYLSWFYAMHFFPLFIHTISAGIFFYVVVEDDHCYVEKEI